MYMYFLNLILNITCDAASDSDTDVRFLSGTRRIWPGNTVRAANRLSMPNSDGVVSNLAATEVNVSDAST